MLQLNHQVRGGVHIVAIDAKILCDEATVDEQHRRIDEVLDKNGVGKLLLDFTQVEIAGSASIRMLIRVRGKCERRGCTLRLCGMQPTVREVLRITNLDTIFEIHDDVEEGVQSLRDES